MACPTDTTCVFGGGQSVATTIDGGQSWTTTRISSFPSGDYMSVFSLACARVGHCMAAEASGALWAIVADY